MSGMDQVLWETASPPTLGIGSPATPEQTMSQARPDPGSSFPRRWFYGLPVVDWFIYRITWLSILPLLKGPIRLKGFGHRGLPQDGPMLLLGNHQTVIDPFMTGWLPFRPSRFMASAQPLTIPLLGRWLRALGAFPKKKFVKDRDSMAQLQELFEDGHQITIFPEGTRSWNGEQMPIGAGIGRLVKRLDAPVVLARMVSGYYFWPRWAHYPRYVPVHIEYEGPLRWPDSATPESITEEIAARLEAPQRIPDGYRTWGFRMAHGLPNYLWACPACFALDRLQVHPTDGNRIVCSHCAGDWQVCVDTTLEPVDPRLWRGTVAEAYAEIVAHFGDRPAVSTDHPDEVLGGGTGTLYRARDGGRGFDVLAAGALALTTEGVRVRPEAGPPAMLAYADIRAVSVELGNKVQLRTHDGLYRLVPDGSSVLMWGHFMHAWRCAVQGLPLTPLG